MNLRRLKRIAKHNTAGLDIACMIDFAYEHGKRKYEISIPVYFWKEKRQFVACYEHGKGIIVYGKGSTIPEAENNFKTNLDSVFYT